MLEERLGLLGPAEKVEYPAAGVEVGGVVGLQLYRAPAHLQGLAQRAPLLREVVGVVVEHRSAVGVDFEGFVIVAIGLASVAHLVAHVAGSREGEHQVLLVAGLSRHLCEAVAHVDHRILLVFYYAHPQFVQVGDGVGGRLPVAQVDELAELFAPDPVEA